MSAAERWERAAQTPNPKPLTQLTRPQLAARVQLLRHGHDPRRARGKGGPPKGPIRQWSREALSDPAVRNAILTVLRDPASPAFASTLRTMLAYGYGQPVQQVRLTGLLAVAARLEAPPPAELKRLACASDDELAALLPEEGEGDVAD